MGFSYRKRARLGRNTWLNVSKSGVSGTMRRGPLSVNSRGRFSVRLAPGLSYRGGCAVLLLVPVTAVAVAAAALAAVVTG